MIGSCANAFEVNEYFAKARAESRNRKQGKSARAHTHDDCDCVCVCMCFPPDGLVITCIQAHTHGGLIRSVRSHL